MQYIKRIGFKFSKNLGWQFFLVIVFPIHFWALILWFQEFDATTEALNSWAAVGEGGYFLAFALFESGVIFLFLTALLLLLPKNWKQEKVFTIAATLYLITAGWFILEQARFLEVMPEENWLIARLLLASPQTTTGLFLGLIFLVSIILPVYFLIKNQTLRKGMDALIERLNLLSMMYLGLDVVGFVIIIIRNIPHQ